MKKAKNILNPFPGLRPFSLEERKIFGRKEQVVSNKHRPNSSIFYSASSDGTVRQRDLNDESKASKTLMHEVMATA